MVCIVLSGMQMVFGLEKVTQRVCWRRMRLGKVTVCRDSRAFPFDVSMALTGHSTNGCSHGALHGGHAGMKITSGLGEAAERN